MRILIGSISYPPNVSGVAVSASLLASHLAAEGHEVTVVTSAPLATSYREHDPKTGLTIYRLRSFPNLWRKGFYIPFFPDREVREIIEKVKPDIIHLQDPMKANYRLCLEARKRNIPVLVTNHFTLDYILAYAPRILHPLVRWHLRKQMVDFYNLCTVVTCPTETVAEILKEMGVTRPVYALSNGVNIHRFYSYVSLAELRARFHFPHLPIVLYVGRIDPEKSLETVLDAIPEVVKQAPAHFVFAGGGNGAKNLEKAVKKAEIEQYATLTGPIPHRSELLVALYQIADIFVMPSPMETQSIVTMEAMAAGKAIVAANSGALPELVEDKGNGLLFEPENSADLTEKLVYLLRHPDERASMGRHSLELIAEHELHTALSLYAKLYTFMLNPQAGDLL